MFMTRIIVCDRTDTYLCEIDPAQIMDIDHEDAVGGVHSLTITTTQVLDKTNRLLLRDDMGIWHEYVVLGIVGTHGAGSDVVNEYYCVWSLQYDLSATFINNMYGCGIVPGHASVPQTAHHALEVALEGTSRWTIGTVTALTMAAASFYRRSGWEGLQTVIERWGGELQATIGVRDVGGGIVISRAVDLLEHIGKVEATRRFDFGHDVTSIKRTVSDDVWPCRIVPLGKSVETEAGGYTRRPDISSVNDGTIWLQDADAVPYTRIPDGKGGWEYPTLIVKNDTYEAPADLKEWATEHITDYTRPKVTYEADLAQFVKAGLNPHGVALGDEVVVVDRTFGDNGLRINARVVKISGSMLDPSKTKLTIGNAMESIAGQLAELSNQLNQLEETVSGASDYQATAEYLSNLLDRINEEVNATGGYVYITKGQGQRTYDVAVSNPLVGSEASQVVEIKGGNIRIANSRTSSGDWDWKTVLQSGHILASLITAANIVSGYIGSANSGNFWNLDTGEFRLAATATIGGRTVSQLLSDVDATITAVDVQYAQNQSNTTPPAESSSSWSTVAPTWRAGYYIWQRTATTNENGTTYSEPTCISGREGTDGASLTVTRVEYGTSANPSTEPTTWQLTMPDVPKGQWLWVRVTYSDNTQALTRTYMGTDGQDGRSVAIQSVTKSGKRTTVVLLNSDGQTETLTIDDGDDGDAGTAGANGYVHTAWANSADGSTDFSTSVSANKKYLGVYSDNTQADSTHYQDYSWSLIKGEKGDTGEDGEDGVGIVSIVEQFYLSTSSTTQTGGSWSVVQPTWERGKYIWTRSEITWDTTPTTTTTTTPVLAQAINSANETADSASTAVSNLSTQEAIFNLLTNNGALQGLYMQNGQLYVNASYILAGYISANLIKGGTLVMGGANNTNGIIQVLDASGNVVCLLNKDGASITGELIMRMGGFASAAKTYGLLGEMVWTGWILGSQTPSGRTLHGLHLYTTGETRNNELLIAPVSETSYSSGQQYGLASILSKGKLVISACAGEVDDNPQIAFGQYYDTAIVLSSGVSSGYKHRAQLHDTNGFRVSCTNDMFYVKASNASGTSGTVYARGTLTVSGFKSRVVETPDYGNRLLYCYEAAKPMFGDVGGGVIGEDGTCYVEIDDILSETVRTDVAYHVFLQKYGAGDLWVSERKPSYFVVEGTAGLEFGWEIKAVQAGYEHTRTESFEDYSWEGDESFYGINVDQAYNGDLAYVDEIESLYEGEF